VLHIVTSSGDGLFKFVNINDLERPWTPKKSFLANFSRFWQHCILRVNYTKMAGDNQDNLHIKFSALNEDFNSPSCDHLGSEEAFTVEHQRQLPS